MYESLLFGAKQPIRKVDVEKRKERFEWPAGTGQERRLNPQKRALSKIGRTSGLGLTRPLPEDKCLL
jgi:hypothetical protein